MASPDAQLPAHSPADAGGGQVPTSPLRREAQPLSGARKVGVLLLPWLFLALFVGLYTQFVLPHARAGNLLAVCFAVLGALVFVSFTLAAVTFSRDVLRGAYP